MNLKVEIIGKEVIKAASSSPSPFPHDHIQLSFIDLTSSSIYVPAIFFYKQENLTKKSRNRVLKKLKSSLSKTLSCFYPLAGRIEGVSINCNNEGAVFTEACTDLLLSDYLENIEINSLKELFPKATSGESPEEWPLLSVQANFFGLGSGVAVAVCISHKICDAASFSTFLQSWAAIARGESKDEFSTPQFAEAAIYPPPNAKFQVPFKDGVMKSRGKCVMNRFVFESCKIKELKRKAVSENVPIPTRVEVISSLIWKCAIKASNFNLDHHAPNSYVMTQAMNMRLRIPSNVLSCDAIGNLQMKFMIKKSPGSDFGIREIVDEFRKTKEELNNMIKENLEDYDATTCGLKLMANIASLASEFKPNMDLYSMTSWCKMPFYEVDFGWGDPVWVGSGFHTIIENRAYAVLMDAKDGEGVEAWICLPEQDMLAFVCDQEFISYASLNPPILI